MDTVAVVGLGYVGLPLAVAFGKQRATIGFDLDERKIANYRNGIDPTGEVEPADLKAATHLDFTSDPTRLKAARMIVVAVPTPIDQAHRPDLTILESASRIIGANLSPGTLVVYESTVYPGCTEEVCVPILERESGMRWLGRPGAADDGKGFYIGYSPERINPGDHEHTIENVIKVVSGCDEESLREIAKTYSLICKAGVHQAPSIKVAEAAKIIENTQRDVNIALMNELSRIFQKLGINTYDVLEAAATKWNFLKFYPGLVGGHCISVDPYYLTYKAHELGYESEVITSGRRINDDMGPYIARRTVQLLTQQGKNPAESKALVMGATFKENVADIRNSKVIDLINELKQFSVKVDVVDPFASSEEMMHEYKVPLAEKIAGPYDAVIAAVAHRQYVSLDENYFLSITNPGAVFADVKGVFRNKITKLHYWSL